MDSVSIITGAIILASCAFLAIIYLVKAKKKAINNLQQLANLAEQSHCKISKHESFSKLHIGLDTATNYLFFIKMGDSEATKQTINLSDFASCNTIKTSRSTNNGNGNTTIIDKLELCFYPKNNSNKPLFLEFYNSTYDPLTLSGELQFVEKWELLISKQLTTKKVAAK